MPENGPGLFDIVIDVYRCEGVTNKRCQNSGNSSQWIWRAPSWLELESSLNASSEYIADTILYCRRRKFDIISSLFIRNIFN